MFVYILRELLQPQENQRAYIGCAGGKKPVSLLYSFPRKKRFEFGGYGKGGFGIGFSGRVNGGRPFPRLHLLRV